MTTNDNTPAEAHEDSIFVAQRADDPSAGTRAAYQQASFSFEAALPAHERASPAVRSASPPATATPRRSAQPPTFAEATLLIDGWSDLSLKQRRDLKAALSTAATIIGQPPGNISCAPTFLNPALYARSAAAFGFSSLYMSQVGSRLRAVLRRLGLHADPVIREDELGIHWRAFLSRMERIPQRSALRGLAAWCDRRNISPAQISDAELLAFCAHEFETRLFAGHMDRGWQLSRAWRAAVAQQEVPSAYPELAPPRKRRAYVPPLSAFPESFQADMASRSQHLSKQNFRIFSGDMTASGPARALRPATIELQTFALRQAAAALIQSGIPIGELRTLRDLVSPPRAAGCNPGPFL